MASLINFLPMSIYVISIFHSKQCYGKSPNINNNNYYYYYVLANIYLSAYI